MDDLSQYPSSGSSVRGIGHPLPRFASFGLGVGRSSGRGGFGSRLGFLQTLKSGLDVSQVGPKMSHIIDQGGQQFLNPRGGRL